MAEKSKVFFTNVKIHLRKDMLSCLEFSEGKLPIRYQGMSLFSTTLNDQLCASLFHKIKGVEGKAYHFRR